MFRVIIAAILLLSPAAAQIRYHVVPKETLLQRLTSAPLKNEDREQALVDMFASVGCKAELEPLPHSKFANVICILPGTSTDTTIVGGHFDHVERGMGIVDDWSGASMLPSLYESLKAEPRRHTIVFVGFAEEEKGLVGSIYYVKKMTSEQRSEAKEMINLECLGMTPTKVWASHSDKKLLSVLGAVADAMKIPLTAVNVEEVGSADSESFAAVNIPRTTIHSIDQETLRILHSYADKMTAIHPDQYYESYRLIAGYLAAVDGFMDQSGPTTQNAQFQQR